MLNRTIVFLGLLVGLLLFPGTAQNSVMAQTGEFVQEPCPLENFIEGENVICGRLSVPQFHADPSRGTLVIRASVFKSTSATPDPTPLLMSSGGPGSSTLHVLGGILQTSVGQSILAQRDVVLFEARGSLYTEPFLFCEPLFELYIPTEEIVAPAAYHAAEQAAAQTCQAKWEGVDLAAYNSFEIIADMVMTIDALGYDTFNYYGVSYGTVYGQHLLREYPARVRSVIFDAVAPLELNMFSRYVFDIDRMYGWLFEHSAQEYPDLENTLITTVERLNAKPKLLTITDTTTGTAYDVPLTGDYLVQTLASMMYWSGDTQIMPDMIMRLAGDDPEAYALIAKAIRRSQTFNRTLSLPLNVLVNCAENADIEPADRIPEAVRPYIAQALADYVDFFPAEACALFEVESTVDNVHAPVTSDVPVLIMSGELDPVTPPAYGEMVAQHLPNAFSYVFPDMGHSSILQGDCAASLMAGFLNDPTREPDASCLADLSFSFKTID